MMMEDNFSGCSPPLNEEHESPLNEENSSPPLNEVDEVSPEQEVYIMQGDELEQFLRRTLSVHSERLVEGSRPHRKIVSCMTDAPYKYRFLKSISILIENPFRFQTSDVSSNDHVFLQCDGLAVPFSVISRVFKWGTSLDLIYFTVAGELYGKIWSHRHVGRSRRLMLDPKFGVAALPKRSPIDHILPLDVFHRASLRL